MRDVDDDDRRPEARRRSDPDDVRDESPLGLERELPRGASREAFEVLERSYDLRGSEADVLRTLGKFGPTHVDDLDMARRGDIRALERQGLIERTQASEQDRRAGRHIVSLSREGRALLEHAEPDRGPYRDGFGRRRELAHDALVYRAYRDAADKVERSGGRVERVASDRELKQIVFGKARGNERELDPETLRQTRAESLGLRVDEDGHVQFPDLHLTCTDRDGHQMHVGVDVVTDSYKAHHVAAKVRAGFHLFRAPRNAVARGGIRDERHSREMLER